MNVTHRLAIAAFLWTSSLSIASAQATPAAPAQPAAPAVQSTTLHASFNNNIGMMTAYSGTFTFTTSPTGAITGTYVSHSDSTRGKIITVTGTLNGTKLHLNFGMGGGIQVDGSYKGGKMSGSASSKDFRYVFTAK
jgi:hypothetical protein